LGSRFTKESGDERSFVRRRACHRGKEGVPLRVVNGASCFVPEGVSIGTERNKTNPGGFLYQDDVGEGRFEDSFEISMVLPHINGENGEVVRH